MAKASPKSTPSDTTVNPTDEALRTPPSGKGRPTPSRKEREAANRRPLVGNTPTDKKAARARLTSERERARVGMANGEERYLPAKDRGEQRRYVRDYIDARWNVGEVMLPVMVVVLLSTFVSTTLQVFSFVLIWGFVALFALDALLAWFLVRKRITRKWGEGSVQRGTFWYIISRAWQMRFLRLPKPQVRRGAYPS